MGRIDLISGSSKSLATSDVFLIYEEFRSPFLMPFAMNINSNLDQQSQTHWAVISFHDLFRIFKLI
jgi:hypothetical protein